MLPDLRPLGGFHGEERARVGDIPLLSHVIRHLLTNVMASKGPRLCQAHFGAALPQASAQARFALLEPCQARQLPCLHTLGTLLSLLPI